MPHMNQLLVIIASQNPVKIACVRQAFERCFPEENFAFAGMAAPSGVPDQPMGEEETLLGARNRAQYCREARPEASYWVGVEGGITDHGDEMEAFAWMAVLSAGKEGKARTANFYLPEAVATLVRQGVELGHADDQVFGRSNSKQGNGAVGILTNGLIDRTAYYEPAVILALIPFMQPELY